MKKFLTLLGAIGLTATASTVVVSCQVEIKGQTLKNLAEKINAGSRTFALDNVPAKNGEIAAGDLKNEIIRKLIKVSVSDYGIDGEGYFKDTSIQTITVGEIQLLVDKKLTDQKITVKQLKTNIKDVLVIIENVNFNFKIQFNFDD